MNNVENKMVVDSCWNDEYSDDTLDSIQEFEDDIEDNELIGMIKTLQIKGYDLEEIIMIWNQLLGV